MTIVTCDRCGKPASLTVSLIANDIENPAEIFRADLCTECADHMVRQIKHLEVNPL